jgi:N-methylhydantoinase A
VLSQEGFAGAALEASLDLRYLGQSYELTVPLQLPLTGGLTGVSIDLAVQDFHRAHAQRYGYAMPDEPVTVVTLRVAGRGPGARPTLPRQELEGASPSSAHLRDRAVWFSAAGPTLTPIFDRAKLRAGNELTGPAVVLQYDATVVITPGWAGRVDGLGSLWLEREVAA